MRVPVLTVKVEAVLFGPGRPYPATASAEVGAGAGEGKPISRNPAQLDKTSRAVIPLLALEEQLDEKPH